MGLFSRHKKASTPHSDEHQLGLLTFDNVNDALAGERALKAHGYDVTLVAPPQHLRTGCDLALAISNIEHVGAQRALEQEGITVRAWYDDTAGQYQPIDLVTTEDLGDWIMVRAGNMKITFEKKTGIIVNTSGGGCPDIPYLNLELVGTKLSDAPRPKELGYTLCGLMLDRAFCEAQELLEGKATLS